MPQIRDIGVTLEQRFSNNPNECKPKGAWGVCMWLSLKLRLPWPPVTIEERPGSATLVFDPSKTGTRREPVE